MKKPSAALLTLLLAAPALASNWEDMMRGLEFPRIQVSGEAPRKSPAPGGDYFTPEMLADVFAGADRLTDEGVAFPILTGSRWSCRRVMDLVSPGEHRRMAFYDDVYTFSPRDRGVRRHDADGNPSLGVNLFAFVPGNGYVGAALDAQGRANSDEVIRFSSNGPGSWVLVVETRSPSEPGATYALCRPIPGS